MKKRLKKPALIFGMFFAVIIFEVYTLTAGKTPLINNSTYPPKQTHAVILTTDGFSPSEITINKGDTIKFKTTTGKPFWPASNLHPTHTIYPEFDPKEPIPPDQSWSFTFTKVGEWKYHDHLSPLYKGKITVAEGIKAVTNPCKDTNDSKKLQCFENLIDSILKNQGLSQAFEILAELFQSDPLFAAECHSFSHKLGEKTYRLFSEDKDFQLSEKSSYCGYGFYHGFMETLLQKTGDMNEARRFCEYADRQLKKTTSDAGGACYHGIGHGSVDGSDPETRGNPEAMVEPGLKLCEMVSNDENPPPRYGKLFRCVSGAFNALEILIDSNKYKLSPNTEDPFWICRLQPDRYKEACYTQFVVAVIHVTGGDFEKSASIISPIPEDDFAIPTLQALVVERARKETTDYSQTINFCRKLSNRFQIPCISAYGEGFLKYGPPQQEYVEAVKFCGSNQLKEEEKKACFARVLSLLRIWYTAEKSKDICQGVDQKYRWQDCQYN